MTRLDWRHYLGIAIITFLIYLPGRMTLPPLDRDEPRYMEASAQMLESHNFVDVTFLDQKRYLQPAGIYWLEAGAEAITGGKAHLHVAWPYRIPGLIAVTAVVTLTAWIGSMLFGALTGIFAAFFLAVSTLMTAEGRMATIDTVLLLDILIVQSALLKTWLLSQGGKVAPRRWAVTFWLALGCGLMLKGPVVLIPAFGTIGALWLTDRQRGWWRGLRFRYGWILSLLVVLPWCIAIGIVSHGDFFRNAVGVNFLGKIGHGQQAHGLPPGYHLAVFLLAFWPGSLFAVLALPQIWANRGLASVRFLLCWIIPHWLVFELIATKLPHYVLPTYPALAILTAAGLVIWAPKSWKNPVGRFLTALYGLLWTVLGVAFAAAGTILIWKDHLEINKVLIVTGTVSIALVCVASTTLIRGRQALSAVLAIGAALTIHAGLFLVVIPRLSMIQLAPHAASLYLARRVCGDDTMLISTSYSEPSLAFLAGSKTRFLNAEEAGRYTRAHPQCTVVLVGRDVEGSFRKAVGPDGGKLELLGRVAGLNYSNESFRTEVRTTKPNCCRYLCSFLPAC